MQAIKRKQRQQVAGAGVMGPNQGGRAACTQACGTQGQVPFLGDAVMKPNLVSLQQPYHQTWPASWHTQLLVWRLVDMAHSSCKKREEGSRLCLSPPFQYTCTQMHLHFYGPMLPWRNCDQGKLLFNTSVSYSQANCSPLNPSASVFDLTTSEQLYQKPPIHFMHLFVLNEWASDTQDAKLLIHSS